MDFVWLRYDSVGLSFVINVPLWCGMLIIGKIMHGYMQRIYGKFLFFPQFCCISKIALKIAFPETTYFSIYFYRSEIWNEFHGVIIKVFSQLVALRYSRINLFLDFSSFFSRIYPFIGLWLNLSKLYFIHHSNSDSSCICFIRIWWLH